jgi:uncharacterized protein YjbI with pentapeptide repeats
MDEPKEVRQGRNERGVGGDVLRGQLARHWRASRFCCPVEVGSKKPCGREIHDAPNGVDSIPVCLMHSRDPAKGEPELDERFQCEIDVIIEEAGEGEADFSGFVFFGFDGNRNFLAKCRFRGAMFTQEANFDPATFAQRADFCMVTFTHTVRFCGANFRGGADFFGATFLQDVTFEGATFVGYTDFGYATFTQRANFSIAKFTEDACFGSATFTRNVDFEGTIFAQEARFFEADFFEAVKFRETRFLQKAERIPGPIFVGAAFFKPELVVFSKTNLSHALFHNCDVTKVIFSSVTWAQRPGSRKRMVFEELVAINQFDVTTNALWTNEGSPDERGYGLISELYQQLKKNYDERKDYWTAGDFHYGEMEMKRLTMPRVGTVLAWLVGTGDPLAEGAADEDEDEQEYGGEEENEKPLPRRFDVATMGLNAVRRWRHQRVSLVACYKYASEYGENYRRPVLWLVGVLVLFAVLFPVKGLRYEPAKDLDAGKAVSVEVLSYWHPAPVGKTWVVGWRAEGELVWNSVLTSIEVAALQKDRMYEPAYRTGRFLMLGEMLVTSSLFALFLLAIRRQFRR